ncbi:hypothetical protein [Clostridium phage Maintenon]|nr:hypothetical protein [Clostridium phage Maintenon]
MRKYTSLSVFILYVYVLQNTKKLHSTYRLVCAATYSGVEQ